jgi:hypothetical protein
MLVSWLIAGSPLYFVHGEGNSAAQSLVALRRSHSPVVPLYHRIIPSLEYVLVRSIWFMPALPALAAACAVLYRRQLLQLLALLPPLPILLMHVLLLYELQSYGEFRYYCYALPLGIAAAALVVARVQGTHSAPGRRWRRLGVGVVLAAAALSGPTTLLAMSDSSLGRQEQPLLQIALGRTSPQVEQAQWTVEQQVARHVDSLPLPEGSVVLDTTAGFPIVLFSHQPRQFIIPSDQDFDAVFQQLSGFRGYVLVSANPNHPSSFVQSRYPGLLNDTEPWAHLVYQRSYWLLYRVATPTLPAR